MDFLQSDGPQTMGKCANDVVGVARQVNAATQRLLYNRAVGTTSWWGGWAEMAFTMTQADPYLVTPFDVTMLEDINVCTYPVPIQNEFYSYLRFGFGRVPKGCSTANRCNLRQGYDRGGFFPTWKDLTPPNKIVRIYSTDAADEGKRVFVAGTDNNDVRIHSLDGTKQVKGTFYDLTNDTDGNPTFVDTGEMNKITGIQKDKTLGQVSFYEVDTVTSEATLILTMEPEETSAAYRRYFLDSLPKNCCDGGETVSVTAIAKLAFVPVEVPTDYLLIPNVEALIHACQSTRYSRMDDGEAKQKADYHMREAVRLLQGQLIHEQGKEDVAINQALFGSARLVHQSIGTLV